MTQLVVKASEATIKRTEKVIKVTTFIEINCNYKLRRAVHRKAPGARFLLPAIRDFLFIYFSLLMLLRSLQVHLNAPHQRSADVAGDRAGENIKKVFLLNQKGNWHCLSTPAHPHDKIKAIKFLWENFHQFLRWGEISVLSFVPLPPHSTPDDIDVRRQFQM